MTLLLWLFLGALAFAVLAALQCAGHRAASWLERKLRAALERRKAVVLRILRESGREMYGLEIVAAAGGQLRRGTVYVVLEALEEQGLVTSRPGHVTVGWPGPDHVRPLYRAVDRPAREHDHRVDRWFLDGKALGSQA